MTAYLYLAKEIGTTNVFKLGKTSRCPSKRCNELPGQTRARFELIAVYPTPDETLAEGFALEAMDASPARRAGSARKETFICTEAQAREACVKAIRRTLKHIALAGAKPTPVLSPITFSPPKTSFWRQIGDMPVTVRTEQITLAQLLSRAAREPKAATRLRALGALKVGFQGSRVEFKIDWSDFSAMGKFARVLGLHSKMVNNERVILSAIVSPCP